MCAAASLGVESVAAHRAVGVRLGNQPGFVRVVVDFTEGPLRFHQVDATDPQPFGDGLARLRVSFPGIRTSAPRVTALGVRVLIKQGTGQILVQLETPPRRFKYLSYFVLSAPERLVIDLWKAEPARSRGRNPVGARSLLDARTLLRRLGESDGFRPGAQPIRAFTRG